MTISPSVRNGQANPGREWINVLVELEQPPSTELTKVHRGERYRRMRDNAGQQRRQLEEWIAYEGLSDAVKSMGEATAFNLLFVQCTPDAAAALAHAPGVVKVMLAENTAIDLLSFTYA